MTTFIVQKSKQLDALHAADAANSHLGLKSAPGLQRGGPLEGQSLTSRQVLQHHNGARGHPSGSGDHAPNGAGQQHAGSSAQHAQLDNSTLDERLVRTWVQEKSQPDRRGHGNFCLRLYTAATLQSMWRRHCALAEGQRHIYELIREGWPCHLYFDLEFDRHVNAHMDGDRAVLHLLNIVRAVVKYALLAPDDCLLPSNVIACMPV